MQNSKKKKLSKAIKENFKFIDINYKFVKKIKKKIITNQNISVSFLSYDKEDILLLQKKHLNTVGFRLIKEYQKYI